MNDRWRLKTVALLACAASLTFAGCGGGGSDDSPPPSPTRFAAEGFWSGSANWIGMSLPAGATPPAAWSSSQPDFWSTPGAGSTYAGMVVLPTGEAWGVYTEADTGLITGALHGKMQVTGSNVTLTSETLGSSGLLNVNYSGSFTPSSQMDLRSNSDSNNINFIASYDPAYDRAASLSQLAGTYAGTGGAYSASPLPGTSGESADQTFNPIGSSRPPLNLLGSNYTITISSTGAVTLPPDPLGCSGTGSATPRTDSNVFNLSLQFSGAKCVLGNGAKVNGIAVVENGHLLMMAVPPGTPTAGEFVFVSK